MRKTPSDCLREAVGSKHSFDAPIFECRGRAKGSDERPLMMDEQILSASTADAFKTLTCGEWGCFSETKTFLCGDEKGTSMSLAAASRVPVVSLEGVNVKVGVTPPSLSTKVWCWSQLWSDEKRDEESGMYSSAGRAESWSSASSSLSGGNGLSWKVFSRETESSLTNILGKSSPSTTKRWKTKSWFSAMIILWYDTFKNILK